MKNEVVQRLNKFNFILRLAVATSSRGWYS